MSTIRPQRSGDLPAVLGAGVAVVISLAFAVLSLG
jgi:hypothetical protein